MSTNHASGEEIAWMSAAELGRRIRRRELSATEVLEATIERIEQRNPSLNAFVYKGFDDARKAAAAADVAIRSGREVGALHGVPVAIKDLFDFKPGWPATFGGVRALANHVLDFHCLFAERMERAGAVLVGKTNSPTMGLRGTCDNYLFGPSRNPFDTSRNTGGSSGGSAAAVADGLVALAEGTDGGGRGEVVHRAAKNHIWCRERSCTPHDVYDRWVELFGAGIDAFYPVLRTDDIGNLGMICCSDGEYPEAVRALAFNGAEVIYRPSEAVPMTQSGSEPGGTWLLQNRAHAHFNNVYMVCPNVVPVYVHPEMEHPFDIAGGNSHIVDYQGNVMGHTVSGYNSFVAGIIDIEALRHFRTMNLNSNWMKDLRTEVCRRMYEVPIHPANLWLDREPAQHDEVDEVYRANIRRLVDRGSYTLPAVDHQGVRYVPAGDSSEQTDWSAVRELWSQSGSK